MLHNPRDKMVPLCSGGPDVERFAPNLGNPTPPIHVITSLTHCLFALHSSKSTSTEDVWKQCSFILLKKIPIA